MYVSRPLRCGTQSVRSYLARLRGTVYADVRCGLAWNPHHLLGPAATTDYIDRLLVCQHQGPQCRGSCDSSACSGRESPALSGVSVGADGRRAYPAKPNTDASLVSRRS